MWNGNRTGNAEDSEDEQTKKEQRKMRIVTNGYIFFGCQI